MTTILVIIAVLYVFGAFVVAVSAAMDWDIHRSQEAARKAAARRFRRAHLWPLAVRAGVVQMWRDR